MSCESEPLILEENGNQTRKKDEWSSNFTPHNNNASFGRRKGESCGPDLANRNKFLFIVLFFLTVTYTCLMAFNYFEDNNDVIYSPRPQMLQHLQEMESADEESFTTEISQVTDDGGEMSSESKSEEKQSSGGDMFQHNAATQACKIPKLNPFDPSLKGLIEKMPNPPKCLKNYPLLYKLEIGRSAIVQVKKPEDFGWKDCCYKVVIRDKKDNDDKQTILPKCYSLKKRTKIPSSHEFIAVFCKSTNNGDKDKEAMLDVFAFAPKKANVENRSSLFYSKTEVKAEQQVNVVMLGIDATSHLNFQRIMPKVREYLINNLSAMGLDGYIKIGDNTFPNLIAILTGQDKNASHSNCSKTKYFDTCPFIWNKFADKGYRSVFAEDAAWMGMFNYALKGFRKPPTDYYLRTISALAEKKIGSDQRGNAKICYGPRLALDFLLDYKKTVASYMGKKKRYFHLTWATSLTHDYINEGKLGQTSVLSYLEWMQNKGHLNTSILLLLSDHGLRWGDIRKTAIGKVEESMPFLYTVFPPWFKTKYSRAITNFQNNKARLSTPFDVYETLLDIVSLERIGENELSQREKKLRDLEVKGKVPRGISLFLPIPKSRTCRMAGIADHWCMCYSWEQMNVSKTEVKQGANYAVFKINSLVSKFPNCSYLDLSSIQNAQLVHSPMVEKGGGKGYEIGFTTTPGNATFEATVVQYSNRTWSVSGSVSRTNLYGNQSHCVSDKEMKKYCYCINA